jgi:broad specificity phosphatase PhoE
LTLAEVDQRYPIDGDDVERPYRGMPGSESLAEFYNRIGTRIRRVIREHPGEHVVVIGHGGTIGASFVTLGGLPVASGQHIVHATRNASLTQWCWTSGTWTPTRFNDAAHVDLIA